MPSTSCLSDSLSQRNGRESHRSLAALAELLPIENLTQWAGEHEAPIAIPEQETVLARLKRALYPEEGHALLTGLPGVGKTTVLRDLAGQSACGEIGYLDDWTFLRIDCQDVPAEESRECLRAIFDATAAIPRLVLSLDGFASLLKRVGGGTNAAVLRSLMHRNGLKLIGVLSPWEYNDLIASDASMRQRFTRVDVQEPAPNSATAILQSAAERLSAFHEIEIPESVTDRVVSLTSHFMLSEQQPAKSISVLQRACEEADYDRHELTRHHVEVTIDDAIRVISDQTGIPEQTIAGATPHIDYVESLSASVVGQEQAVTTVANELRLIKAGLNEPGKPASVLLFAGLTGVGKTELAKHVAELYSTSKSLRTYSMGNFTEPHSVSGIVGVPPGYVGHEEGGRLVNDLNADPYSVFLLDEAEKAHPNVWKPFLNLFDEGWIVDQRGVKAYADRAIFILTTNAGDRAITQMTRSGKSSEDVAELVKSALARIRQERSSQPVFPPQFLARIKRIVVFTPLDESAMVNIAQLCLSSLQSQWAEKRGKRLQFDADVPMIIGVLAHQKNEASGGKEGGRIVRKLVSDLIEIPIQDEAGTRSDLYAAAEVIRIRSAGSDNELHSTNRPGKRFLIEF